MMPQEKRELPEMHAEELVRTLDAFGKGRNQRKKAFPPEVLSDAQRALDWIHERGIAAMLLQGLFPVEALFSERSVPPFFHRFAQLVLGILTIGPELEEEATSAFQRGETMRGLLLDHAGTMMLRKAFFVFQETLTPRGWYSHRMAPGCPGIPLQAQHTIFHLLEAGKRGLHINASFMIHPLKSSSFAIGLLQEGERGKRGESLCISCPSRAHCDMFGDME
ncbi:MAG TPA: hypothetical protein P5560_06080 [Thermotogota bacterium]|nr:hypothetical protein [Thermotogota bacterium]HRW92507.1 hypothetical protein [Thermotogota bacterium]